MAVDWSNVKTRRWRSPSATGQKRTSVFVPWKTYLVEGPESYERRWSVSHGRLNDGRWSGGGPFHLQRETDELTPPLVGVKTFTGGGSPLRDGTTFLASIASAVPQLQMPDLPSDDELDALGTTAIARVNPLNPAFDLSTFIGELLKEGLPNMPGSAVRDKTALAKASGSEYLNVEFGWLPMLRGVQDFADVVERSDDIVRQFQEEAGKVLSRSYEWPTYREERFDVVNFTAADGAGFFTGGGRHQEVVQKTWFEADFIYFLPTGGEVTDKFRRYASIARKLYGIDISPEVLWNLAPWSWAVDWFSNAGDVMTNISLIGQDGLVIRNGYVMCHTKRTVTDTGTFQNQSQTRVSVLEYKQRRPATPYGFGVSFGSLSTKQIAILSALGLSRW